MRKNEFTLRIILINLLIIAALLVFLPRNVHAAVYNVRQDGTGDFLTIQQAVKACSSGDTINIGSGTYKESVIISGKTVNLTGSGRDTCVITYPTSNYMAVPLFIQAGTVKNLTIKGYGSVNGYVVHIDNPYQFGRRLTFENCSIISAGSKDCLGIGTYGGSNIVFNNCTLKSDGEVLFYHNNDKNDYPGKSSITFNGCVIKSPVTDYIRKAIFPTNNTVSLNMNNTKEPDKDAGSDTYMENAQLPAIPPVDNTVNTGNKPQEAASTYGNFKLDENGYIIF